jgi:hypothetical protein
MLELLGFILLWWVVQGLNPVQMLPSGRYWRLKEQEVSKGPLDPQVLLDLQVLLVRSALVVLQARKAVRVLQVLLVHKEHKEHKVLQAHKVYKDKQEPLAHKVQRVQRV